jgi:hypothetical protein
MFAKAQNEVLKLHAELVEHKAANKEAVLTDSPGKGIIPDHWVPWVNLILICLTVVYFFMPEPIRTASGEILSAVKEWINYNSEK